MADYFHVTGEERRRCGWEKTVEEGFAAHVNEQERNKVEFITLTISFMIGALSVFGMRYICDPRGPATSASDTG